MDAHHPPPGPRRAAAPGHAAFADDFDGALAVGFLAWVNVFGQVDRFAAALFYFALFVFVVVAPKVFRRDVPFSPGWWAISFPMAALASAAIVYSEARGGAVLHGLAGVLLVVLTLALAVLTVRTLHWVFSGKLFATA